MEKISSDAELYRVDGGLNVAAPEFMPLSRKREEICPIDVMSCSFEKYDRCCVPEKGRITLVQQWNTQEKIEAFTLHGLWPGDCTTGTGPWGGCDESPKYQSLYYNVMADPTLSSLMTTYWPDSTGLLWTEQWNKHGTCLSIVESACYLNDPSPSDAIRYFRLALNTYFSFDIMAELKLADIEPGKSYPKEKFYSAMSEWRSSVELRCRGAQLYEVRIYLTGMSYDNFALQGQAAESNCPDLIRFAAKPPPANFIQYYSHNNHHDHGHDELK